MKNKFMVLTVVILTFVSANAFAETKWLTVFNTWSAHIHIKEGILGVKEADIMPGGMVTWGMVTGTVINFSVKYLKNGKWEYIPGCPSGTFIGGARISVVASLSDPKVPMCRLI